MEISRLRLRVNFELETNLSRKIRPTIRNHGKKQNYSHLNKSVEPFQESYYEKSIIINDTIVSSHSES